MVQSWVLYVYHLNLIIANSTHFQMQQHLSEWRSGIGSSAISMMISFFVRMDADIDVPAAAEALFENYGYLCDNPSDRGKESLFHSVFLIELLGTAHLNNIVGYVNVPEWGTGHLAAGKDMAGVVGMAAATVMFCLLDAYTQLMYCFINS